MYATNFPGAGDGFRLRGIRLAWQNRRNKRQVRAKRAGESLVHAGYDYEGCFVTPFDGGADSKTPKSGAHRPTWTHFARVPQGRESILLRSKFTDWGETFTMTARSVEDEQREHRDRGVRQTPDRILFYISD